MSKNQTVGVDSEDDSDDYDIAEANCELAMVEGQLCSVPYELYDLPDLTGVLSVETWDSLLTEEERFLLSRFLPDMDEETFSLTMQELVGGADWYFGNPVNKFYKSLSGGLLSPKVACCRDGVTLFKRKKYYYSLKSYHEKMIKTFTEMQAVWDRYGKKLDNKTRLLLWSERKQSENLKLLDLNRVPYEEIGEMMPVERYRTESLAFPCGDGGSKNALKVKITEKGAFRYPGYRLFGSSEHLHQTLPKGLLKVAPKYSSPILEEPYLATENNLLQIHETGSMSGTRFAASPYSGTIFRKPFGTIAGSVTDPSVFHDPTHTNPRGIVGAPSCSIAVYNLPTNEEEYAHYHLKPPGFKPEIVERSSKTTETKRVSSGKNFQRKPLRVLSEDDHHHARETAYDNLFSVTYKRRKVQTTGIA